jgi:hypothetical protein
MLIPFVIHVLQTYLNLVAFVIHFFNLLSYNLPFHYVHVSTLLIKAQKEIKIKLAQGIKKIKRLNKVPLATRSNSKNNLLSPLSLHDTQKDIHIKKILNDICIILYVSKTYLYDSN